MYVRTRQSLPFPIVDFGTNNSLFILHVHVLHYNNSCHEVLRSKLVNQMSPIMHRWALETGKQLSSVMPSMLTQRTLFLLCLLMRILLQDALTHVSKARQTHGQSRRSTEHEVRKTLKMWRLKGTVMTRQRMNNIPRINRFSPSRCPP